MLPAEISWIKHLLRDQHCPACTWDPRQVDHGISDTCCGLLHVARHLRVVQGIKIPFWHAEQASPQRPTGPRLLNVTKLAGPPPERQQAGCFIIRDDPSAHSDRPFVDCDGQIQKQMLEWLSSCERAGMGSAMREPLWPLIISGVIKVPADALPALAHACADMSFSCCTCTRRRHQPPMIVKLEGAVAVGRLQEALRCHFQVVKGIPACIT